jgi:hypothetical protein
MSEIDAAHLAGFEHQLDLDLDHLGTLDRVSDRRLYTYLFGYPLLRSHFERMGELDLADLISAIAVVYGLMPTTMNLRKGDPATLLGPVRALRRDGRRLAPDELAALKAIVNNSVVGASKLLHFGGVCICRMHGFRSWISAVGTAMH